jgi:ABC-2 type transport system ATP-binding protein
MPDSFEPMDQTSQTTRGAALEVLDAAKAFGATQALRGASLVLRPGELLGLLGPNGAGKTTLIRAIAGRVRLDSGQVRIFGSELKAGTTAPELGIVPQELAVYPLLTPAENLATFGQMHGVRGPELSERVRWALAWSGLEDRRDEVVKNFSGGMRRRLNIACATLHRPKILLLDEPTVGVDPQSREKLYSMIEELRGGGAAVLLTTHHLEEAEIRCGRIVIIDHGRVAASGTLAELIQTHHLARQQVCFALEPGFATLDIPGVEVQGLEARVEVENLDAELPGLLGRLRQSGARVRGLEVRKPSLQHLFIQLTGKDLRE